MHCKYLPARRGSLRAQQQTSVSTEERVSSHGHPPHPGTAPVGTARLRRRHESEPVGVPRPAVPALRSVRLWLRRGRPGGVGGPERAVRSLSGAQASAWVHRPGPVLRADALLAQLFRRGVRDPRGPHRLRAAAGGEHFAGPAEGQGAFELLADRLAGRQPRRPGRVGRRVCDLRQSDRRRTGARRLRHRRLRPPRGGQVLAARPPCRPGARRLPPDGSDPP